MFTNIPPLAIVAVGFIIMLMLSSRSKKAQERQVRERMEAIKRGDRIQTIGGILGKVVDVEPTRIQVKVDESSNTKIWFARAAISRVVEDDKADGKSDAKSGK